MVFFQKLCEHKLGWDEAMLKGLLKVWRTLVTDLQKAGHCLFPDVTCLKWRKTECLTVSVGFVMRLQGLMQPLST